MGANSHIAKPLALTVTGLIILLGGYMMNQYGYPSAIAYVKGGGENPNLTGTVKFFQRYSGTLVVAEITGLPNSDTGIFAFHVHEGDSCDGEGFPGTGTHYNSTDAPHPKHKGDLPPLLGNDGRAYLAVFTNRFRPADVIGRTVVIHSDPDDFQTQPSGNAGAKIACGVIRGV